MSFEQFSTQQTLARTKMLIRQCITRDYMFGKPTRIFLMPNIKNVCLSSVITLNSLVEVECSDGGQAGGNQNTSAACWGRMQILHYNSLLPAQAALAG